MERNMKDRITRIAEMEARLNRITAWLENASGDVREDVRLLDEYYRGPLWRSDFEADEAGELPADLPRGVLSEDAVYNALSDYEEQKQDGTAKRVETMREWTIDRISILENRASARSELPALFGPAGAQAARAFHAQIKGYEKTPLVSLPHLAEKLNVSGVYCKDESKRFSLNAFKGLGGSYAMFRVLCERLGLDPERTSLQALTEGAYKETISKLEFVTCTDGNHGRGVSWAAGLFGCKAHVYMPCGSQAVRAEAIRRVGPAEVEITELNYDDAVAYAEEMSRRQGWILIQDTAWDGYEKIPAWIIQGYLTMASETAEELDRLQVRPTHIFLQAGVGAMAGGVLSFFAGLYGGSKPVTAIVEPAVADCIYRSAKAGAPRSVEGAPTTIMAGLNCGTPCGITWPVLRDYAEFYVSGPDEMAAAGMRAYAEGLDGDARIVSGESGAATLGAAQAILGAPAFSEVKKAMGFDERSVLLLISTEGDTDPENYRKIVDGDHPFA